MADHERSSTKYQSSAYPGTDQSRRTEDRPDSRKSENRSDREYDSYDFHGSFRTSREERTTHQGQDRVTNRGRHSQDDYTSDRGHHRYAQSEDRRSGSVMKHRRGSPHGRSKTINNHSPERFDGVDDTFYRKETSNGYRTTNLSTNERRRSNRDQPATFERLHERYERKDEQPDLRKIVHERQHHWGNENPQKNYHDKEEEQEYQRSNNSPACAHPYSSSDVTSLKSGPKLDPVNTDDLDEGTEQHPSTTDRPSEHRHRQRHHNSSRGRPSSRGSSSGASDDTDDSRAIPKKGLFSQHSSQRDRHYSRNRSRSRSPSYSESRAQPESRHRGRSRSSSPGGNHSSKYSRSRKPSGKRKRSTSREERKRRKHKEKEREKDRETSREKKKRDEERRSVLTGKKIKLKVKKDKGDHERDANRKDLLQFLNSAFE